MKPSILIVMDTSIIGGPGKGLFQFLSHCTEEDLDYLICNYEYNRNVSSDFNNYAKECGFNLTTLVERFRFDPTPIHQCYKILNKGNFNIIQSHNYKSHLSAFLISRICGIPWVAFSHGWTSEDAKVKLYHSLDKILLQYATYAVAVSPPLFQAIKEIRGPNKPTFEIWNAVEKNEAFDIDSLELRKKHGISEDELLIGCFGRLSPEKGQSYLLKALASLRQEGQPAISLIVAGDGPDKAALLCSASRYGLDKKVFFVGHQRELRNYFRAIDLLILPSLSEGLPNVVLEAMSNAVPVIATSVGAVPQIIIDGVTGWLVPPGNVAHLTEKISLVLENRSFLRDIGEKARASLFPRFSPELRAKKILAVYNQCLMENPYYLTHRT